MEVVAVLVVSAVGLMAFWASTGRDPLAHRLALRAGLVAHVVAPQLLWWQMTSWLDHPEGDQLTFFLVGQRLLDAVWYEPDRYLPVVGRMLASGSSTEVMEGVAAVLLALVAYPTAGIVVVSFFAYYGQLALYRALRDRLSAEHGLRVAAACLMVPSADYWTSGLVKEALAVGGLGMVVAGASRLTAARRWSGSAMVFGGAVVVAQTKAYVLFPLSVSLALWWYWDRQSLAARSAILARPWRIVLLGLVVAGTVYALSSLFPRFSPEQFAVEASRQRGYAGGGSAFTLATSEDGDRGVGGEFALAPLGAFNALYRPFLFEIRNALMVPAAIESTALLVLTLRGLFGPGPVLMGRRTVESPLLLACAVFVVMFAVAVGLTTLNFGTMSRYRVPMLPFVVVWLLVCGRPAKSAVDRSARGSTTSAAAVTARRVS